MNKLEKLKRSQKKAIKLISEIRSTNLDDLVGKKVRLTKECVDWYKAHGEECGISFDILSYILKRPSGIIISARYDGFPDGFNIKVEFRDKGMSRLFGIEDIKEIN